MKIISAIKNNSYIGSMAIVVAMVWWFIPDKKAEQVEDSVVERVADSVEVRYENIYPESIKTEASSWGTTEPINYSKVKTEKDGRVALVMFEQGDSVSKGDVILELDTKKLNKDREYFKQLVKESKTKLKAYEKLSKSKSISELDLISARTRYEESLSRLEDTDDAIRKSKIVAPFDGVIGDMDIKQGDFLSKNSFVANLYDLSQVKVLVSVPERYINKIRKGQSSEITINKTTKITGEVTYVSRIANSENHMFYVEIVSEKYDGLYAGATARAQIEIDAIEGYRIKSSSLAINKDSEMGIKVIEGDEVKFIPVSIVKSVSDELVITGPQGGSRIITTGAEWVSDGEIVTGFKEGK